MQWTKDARKCWDLEARATWYQAQFDFQTRVYSFFPPFFPYILLKLQRNSKEQQLGALGHTTRCPKDLGVAWVWLGVAWELLKFRSLTAKDHCSSSCARCWTDPGSCGMGLENGETIERGACRRALWQEMARHISLRSNFHPQSIPKPQMVADPKCGFARSWVVHPLCLLQRHSWKADMCASEVVLPIVLHNIKLLIITKASVS